ncbi:MAG TPA: HigA family addiction module antitoxin [Streptosporangiaceae bacterium]
MAGRKLAMLDAAETLTDLLIPPGNRLEKPPRRINEIMHGQRRISAATALCLARYFGTSERFWMNLQARYDLEVEKDRLGDALDEIQPLSAAG